MIGVYDFCGHYDWTFEWLRSKGGEGLLREYWRCAIGRDSQRHALEVISKEGFGGMAAYWGHTLSEEAAEYFTSRVEGVFRIDMHRCPSKGFLLRNGLGSYHDYCDHCMGWIGPMLQEAGFTIDHEHNHCGQCWWEIRRKCDGAAATVAGEIAGSKDVRLQAEWSGRETKHDKYRRTCDPDEKT